MRSYTGKRLSNLNCRQSALLPLGTHPIHRYFAVHIAGYMLGENPLAGIKPTNEAALGSASMFRKGTMRYLS